MNPKQPNTLQNATAVILDLIMSKGWMVRVIGAPNGEPTLNPYILEAQLGNRLKKTDTIAMCTPLGSEVGRIDLDWSATRTPWQFVTLRTRNKTCVLLRADWLEAMGSRFQLRHALTGQLIHSVHGVQRTWCPLIRKFHYFTFAANGDYLTLRRTHPNRWAAYEPSGKVHERAGSLRGMSIKLMRREVSG